jgi:hypothetical protein
LFANLIDLLLDVVVELAKHSRGQTLQIHILLHGLVNFGTLLSDLVRAQFYLLLEALHLLAMIADRDGLLMPRRFLNCVNYGTHLFMLVLQVLQPILLSPILADKDFHVATLLDLIDLLLHRIGVLVDEHDELLSHAHYHVTDIIFPDGQVVLGIYIILDGLTSLISDFAKLIHRRDVALVDVLNVFLVDKT